MAAANAALSRALQRTRAFLLDHAPDWNLEPKPVPHLYQGRSARYAVRWPVLLAGPIPGRARVVNISDTGVLFIAYRPYQVGQCFRATLDLATLPKFSFTVKIVRQRHALYGWYAYGATFTEMADADCRTLQTILAMLQQLLSENASTAAGRWRRSSAEQAALMAR